jgi:hypothetical protein
MFSRRASALVVANSRGGIQLALDFMPSSRQTVLALLRSAARCS